MIYVNGDSFSYGYGLADNQYNVCIDDTKRLNDVWSGNFKEQVFNDAIPRGSNDRIIRTTIEFLNKNVPKLVIIGWSGKSRREFYIKDMWYQVMPHKTYHKDKDIEDFNKQYSTIADSEYESNIRYITQIILLQTFLKYKNIPYLFFNSIEDFNIDNANIDMNFFEKISMNTYLKQFNNVKLNDGHPNKLGNFLWYQYLIKKYGDYFDGIFKNSSF